MQPDDDLMQRARRRVNRKLMGFARWHLRAGQPGAGRAEPVQRPAAGTWPAGRLGARPGHPRRRRARQPARRRPARALAAREIDRLKESPVDRIVAMSSPQRRQPQARQFPARDHRTRPRSRHLRRAPFRRQPRRRRAPRAGPPDPARIRTRFPPEPNGYLHIGHAKSICLNFGLAADYGGVCHMRFDDTNPEKEEQEYVDSILDAVHWLGFDWQANGVSHLYHASDYFDFMYRAAEALVEAGHAYVDEQSADDDARAAAATSTRPGTDSPFRSRTPAENLARLREMRDGQHADGAMVLRAKIDMASAEHQPARPGAVPHQARDAPQHRRRLVHLPDVHLRAPDRGRARKHHAQHLHARVRGPAPVLRLAARAPGRLRPAGAPAAAAVRVRAAEPELHRDQQAQAAPAGRGRHRRRLGRPADADDRRHAPARLHARQHPRCWPSAAASARPAAGSTTRRWTSRCATTWTQGAARDGRARPAASSCSTTGTRSSARGQTLPCTAPLHPRPAGARLAPLHARPARSGSSARTSWKSR